MTNNLSERAKLVTVLCTILHLRGDDAKVIVIVILITIPNMMKIITNILI